jgi:kumamolisin
MSWPAAAAADVVPALALCQTRRQQRNLPDVALAADPDVWPYEVYVPNEGEEFSTTGGTAPAAAVWAGYLALVNQCRRSRELTPVRLGASNSQLYAIGTTKWQAAQAFRNCTQGSTAKYSAGPGWDAVTGWNSMDGKMLTSFLCPGYVSGHAAILNRAQRS